MAAGCSKPELGAVLLTNKRFVFIKLSITQSIELASESKGILDFIGDRKSLDVERPISDILNITPSSWLEKPVFHLNTGEIFKVDKIKYSDLKNSIEVHQAMNLTADESLTRLLV